MDPWRNEYCTLSLARPWMSRSAPGPAPTVPSSWQNGSFDGISFSVPSVWRTLRTADVPGFTGGCSSSPFVTAQVILSTDEQMDVHGCPAPSPEPQQALNGLQVDGGPQQRPVSVASRGCLNLSGLRACPATGPDLHAARLSSDHPRPLQAGHRDHRVGRERHGRTDHPVLVETGVMVPVRKFGPVAMAVLTLAVAACTSAEAVPSTTQTGFGTVKGYADACAGPPPPQPGSHVTVALYSGQALIASETIRAGATYRFSVAPGSYRVKGPGAPAKVIMIPAGHVVTDNIPNLCR